MASGILVHDDPIPVVMTAPDVVTAWTALSMARDRWASDIPAPEDLAEHGQVGAEILSAMRVLEQPMIAMGADIHRMRKYDQ
jgi:hypothetical protein